MGDGELVELFSGYGVNRDSAAHFRGRLERRLLLQRCDGCGAWHHPPRPICPRCWSTDVIPTAVAGRGMIHLATFLHQGPPADGVDYSTPYPIVTVQLDEQEGLRFTSAVVGATNDEIRIGAQAELDWIQRGAVPVPVFRLADGGRKR